MNLKSTSENFIQQNSPDGAPRNYAVRGKDFLQSEAWRKFQESFGHRTFEINSEDFHASIIEHELPLVGKYFYIPRGPITSQSEEFPISNDQFPNKHQNPNYKIQNLIDLAKKEKSGWIRFDVSDSRSLDLMGENLRIMKAPHDMQPREVFIVNIEKSEEQLLAEMKSKTRYNMRLAEKKGVSVRAITNNQETSSKYFEEFLRLVKVTAKRDGIVSHPEEYYRLMFEIIPEENLRLYVAEYEGKVIVANLVIFYGNTATYLHGSSDNEYRNVMAPYLLQWQQIQDAKKAGCAKYDFGGIKSHNAYRITHNEKNDTRSTMRDIGSWSGITKFKTGFSPETKPTEFFGSYAIIINPWKYFPYKFLQKLKSFL